MILVKLAARNILRQKTRTLAVIFTLILGISSLVIYHGFNTGIMNQYRENTIHARTGHGQINIKNYRETIWEKPWEQWMEEDHPIIKELEEKSFVTNVFPRVSFYGLVNNGTRSISGLGEGALGPIESKFFTTINIIEGKNLSTEEDGIVLGKGLAEALNLKIGDRVTILANTIDGSINGLDFYLVGIFHSGMKYFDDLFFKIQLDKAQLLLDSKKIEYVALGLNNLSSWNKIEESIKTHPDLEATPFNILDKVYYQNSVDFLTAQFNFVLVVIITIVVLGIFNTVSTIIMERKNEFGNLRANGESHWDVLKLILVEGGLLGLMGSILGVVWAFILTFTVLANGIEMPPGPGITRQFITHLEIELSFVLVAISLGVCSTLLGTLLAGRKIIKMKITDLLRN